MFLRTNLGKEWISSLNVYPPFLSQSFIDFSSSNQLITSVRNQITQALITTDAVTLKAEESSFSQLAKSLKELNKHQILGKNALSIEYKGRKMSPPDFLIAFKEALVHSETLNKSKDGFLLFNKFKTSEKTLEELEILGTLVGWCLLHNIPRDLPFHASILATINFGM